MEKTTFGITRLNSNSWLIVNYLRLRPHGFDRRIARRALLNRHLPRQQAGLGSGEPETGGTGRQVEIPYRDPHELLRPPISFLYPANSERLYRAEVLSFPDGRVLNESKLGNQGIDSVTKGQYLITEPFSGDIVSIYNPIQTKFEVSTRLPAIERL